MTKDHKLEEFIGEGFRTVDEIGKFLNMNRRDTTQYMSEQKNFVPYAYGNYGYYIPNSLNECNGCYKIMRLQAISLMISARRYKRTAEQYFGEQLCE